MTDLCFAAASAHSRGDSAHCAPQVLCGLFGVAINQTLTVQGVHLAGASLAAVLQPLVPVSHANPPPPPCRSELTPGRALKVLCGAADVALKRIRPRWYHAVGLFFAVGGALLVLRVDRMAVPSTAAAREVRLGALLLLGAVLVIATAIQLQRTAHSVRIPPMSATFFSFLYGSLVIGPYAAFSASSNHVRVFDLPAKPWLGAAYCGIVGTSLTDCISFWSLQTITPSQASLYICLQPVLTVILSAIFLGESITWFTVVGGLAVILGLVFVVGGSERDRRRLLELGVDKAR